MNHRHAPEKSALELSALAASYAAQDDTAMFSNSRNGDTSGASCSPWRHINEAREAQAGMTQVARLNADLAAVGTHASEISGYVHRTSAIGDFYVIVPFDNDELPFGVDGDLEERGDEDGAYHEFVATAIHAAPGADLLPFLRACAAESKTARKMLAAILADAQTEASE
jgi:hypothetical protein